MTTIAYKDGVLAGDTLADRGGLAYFVDAKVFVLADGRLFGGCGDWSDVLLVRRWLEDDRGKEPSVSSNFSGILVEDGVATLLESQLVPMPLPFPFFAVGSGRDFAIAAMHLGRTAREAVELATVYDTYTGGEIVSVQLPLQAVA